MTLLLLPYSLATATPVENSDPCAGEELTTRKHSGLDQPSLRNQIRTLRSGIFNEVTRKPAARLILQSSWSPGLDGGAAPDSGEACLQMEIITNSESCRPVMKNLGVAGAKSLKPEPVLSAGRVSTQQSAPASELQAKEDRTFHYWE